MAGFKRILLCSMHRVVDVTPVAHATMHTLDNLAMHSASDLYCPSVVAMTRRLAMVEHRAR